MTNDGNRFAQSCQFIQFGRIPLSIILHSTFQMFDIPKTAYNILISNRLSSFDQPPAEADLQIVFSVSDPRSSENRPRPASGFSCRSVARVGAPPAEREAS